MSLVAPEGATSRMLMTCAWPCPVRMSMKPPPPMPLAIGFITPWHSAVATAPSMALPPPCSTRAPAPEAAVSLSRGSHWEAGLAD